MSHSTPAANALRFLAIDAVEKAKSGHPGMPMGMADIATVLWQRHLRHNPANPHWPDRDRFVLSNGHGSMLLYALLHLTGYDLPLDELKQLPPAALEDAGPSRSRAHARRRDHDRAAGPGPRQRRRHGAGRADAGARSSTGRAIAIVDHRTYVFVGDGCLMEGVSHEAASLAGVARPRQARRALRRQRHLDRRRSRGLVPRRHARRASAPTAGT